MDRRVDRMPGRDRHRFRVASSEDVRDVNRRLVLNLIRAHQPVSRADLARLSGMQRSTISLIVEQLLDESWVLEGAMGRLPRGRRPTFLQLNNDRVIIAVDLRPTQTTLAVADVNGHFAAESMAETPRTPEAAVNAIVQRLGPLLQACRGKKVEGIGVTLPGRYDRERGTFAFAPNLEWGDVDLGGRIAAAAGLEVELENAANACVLSAVWFDHNDPWRDLVVVTVSEGIGTGILANGELIRGTGGMAGEFGHVPIDPDGPRCACGGRGCWEVFASNRAALRYYAGRRERGALTFDGLLQLVEGGDRRAMAALDTMAHYLGRGMRVIVAGLAPDRIIVVGDVTRVWGRIVGVLEAELRSQVLPGGRVPRLGAAREDGMARLRGAVALVLQKHFGTPPQIRL